MDQFRRGSGRRMMQDNNHIESSRVRLVPMSLEMVTERYRLWLSDPIVNAHLSSRNVTIKELQIYVQSRIGNPNVLFWAVCDKISGEHIGNVKIEPIDWETKSGVFGMMLGERSYWGRGIASEVTSAVVEYLFEEKQLKTVQLGVELTNEAAIRVYEKSGFKIVKTELYPRPSENGSHGKHVMEVSKDDFRSKTNKSI